jgi:hypothetical protein
MLVVSDEALDTAPGRIQAWSIVRQEYPELVDRAARPRLTRRLGSRTKSAIRTLPLWNTSRAALRSLAAAVARDPLFYVPLVSKADTCHSARWAT